MHCLLLGGGGFIGAAVADELIRAGSSIRILERPEVHPPQPRVNHPSVEWMPGNFLDQGDIARAVAGVDAVVHLVSTTLPKSSNDDPVFDIQSNVGGTLQLLDQMVKRGVKRVVFASSGGTVYGAPEHMPIREDHPTNPLVSYGIAKLTIEKYLALYRCQYGLEPVVLRVANPYGWGQRLGVAQGAVGEFINRALSDERIDIWGDGSVVRDYVYVSDVARAFCLALGYQGAEGVFNIGSGVGTSLNDLITLIEVILGHSIERQYSTGRNFDVPMSVLDISRARRELGWVPEVDLASGLQQTVAWFLSQCHMPVRAGVRMPTVHAANRSV
ncbi:NAD-dependent epimerase/dehydratase family protein [Burkholderia vietnamiensis]|uniref:NAD-dependent epimerase/dehydratase family protein n=1 Tax=Burkholderia vietnamiensis TaxID=60552 RepID=UPI002DD4267B|nr:NAD-dependent epimerase/dehydratase family protein [Burkholderia vietnamiensis]MEC4596525.1 NAD-dependent epimerase/dehydratase family protein [Burkholderia vietnamiensis]